MKETCYEHIDGNEYGTFCSSEKRWITKILNLKEKYPEEINIVHHPEDNYGVLLARIPKRWFKISPPRQVNFTDEQRAALAQRMAEARAMKDNGRV